MLDDRGDGRIEDVGSRETCHECSVVTQLGQRASQFSLPFSPRAAHAHAPARTMQASSAFAVGLSRCCSRTFLHSARGASRIRAACRPRRVASTATASASGAGDADSSSTGAAATTSPSPAPKGNRDLRDALSELRDVLLDPNKLVRAVAGGKSKGADPRWRKLEMRPVALKRGGIKLQVVKYDERQAFTSNHAYANGRVTKERGKEVLTASAAAEEALAIPFKTWRVETADEVLNLQVSKSGGATVKRTRQLLSNASKGSKNTAPGGAAGGGPAAHDKVKPRLLAPSDPFLIRVGVSKEDGSDVKHAKARSIHCVVPIRPRSRGERRSLRTFPGVSLRPPLAFNPRPRRLSTPSDAFQLHPDFALHGTTLSATSTNKSRNFYVF